VLPEQLQRLDDVVIRADDQRRDIDFAYAARDVLGDRGQRPRRGRRGAVLDVCSMSSSPSARWLRT
jgi:hypothetical protein